MSEVDFLVGREVVDVEVDSSGGARIIFERGDKPEPALYADVGSDATHADPSGETRPLADTAGRSVAASSTADGTLLLTFADGASLRCEPAAEYEAWQVVGGTPQYLVVCSPGGELTVFDSSFIPTKGEAEETIGLLNRLTGWNLRVGEVTESGRIEVEPDEEPADAGSESEKS